ncbi:MAG TPA: carboxymuconolactone decarboxylase family protein [Alphaproteobacteria bacterium]|jgi:uncharacterized peroxidase-related enzyme|nr:carboxymuconolactone decarboxylase family protein [Alphaproteobacteria bacterium]
MRGDSPLTAVQRETIAAYVSKLNDCDYCFDGHSQMAVNLGVDRVTIERIIDDVDSAPVEESFKPILRFVKKLTLTPARMTQADADAVFRAGWSERALHDAILVCCRFNYVNRLAMAHGLDTTAESPEDRARNMGYTRSDLTAK